MGCDRTGQMWETCETNSNNRDSTYTRLASRFRTAWLQTRFGNKNGRHLHVDEIVQNDQIARSDIFFQRTGRRRRNDVRTSQGFQGPDVGPIVDVGRTYRVLAPVSGNKNFPFQSG